MLHTHTHTQPTHRETFYHKVKKPNINFYKNTLGYNLQIVIDYPHKDLRIRLTKFGPIVSLMRNTIGTRMTTSIKVKINKSDKRTLRNININLQKFEKKVMNNDILIF